MAGMLAKYQEALLLSLRGAEEFALAPPARDEEAWECVGGDERLRLASAADAALARPIPDLSATAYLAFSRGEGEADYLARYDERRAMLRDLALGLCVKPGSVSYARKLSDVLWAICEESGWLAPSANALSQADGLPDPDAPLVDARAADTAYDLAVCRHMLAEPLNEVSPAILRRVEAEVYFRVVAPFLRVSDAGFMCAPKTDMARVLAGCLCAILTFERDKRQRWHAVRKAWLLLDALLSLCSPDGSLLAGVSGWARLAEPLTDCLSMIFTATGGEVDARGEPLVARLCRFPVNMHIARGWFVNPGGTMRPELDGIGMYRVGVGVRDAWLCDLGAYLHQTLRLPPPADAPLLRRAFRARRREEIEREPLNPPLRPDCYLPALHCLTARQRADDERGLAAAIVGGDNGAVGCHLDTGNVVLFLDGRPILVDAADFAETNYHNLPTIDGMGQKYGAAYGAGDASCRLEDDFALITMDLARAYPDEAEVTGWQRTLVLDRSEGGVQLMDVFDLKRRANVSFHFVTPCKPSVSERYAQIGGLRLRWEAGLMAESEEIGISGEWGETLHRLTLTTLEPSNHGKYTFLFHPMKTYG